jgi:type II secretory pathway pseudopilin PulG
MITWIIISLALAVIAILTVVALRLVVKVKRVEAERALVLQERNQKQQAQRAYLVESLNVISATFLNEELNGSEAAIRSKMLLDGLMLTKEQRKPYAAIETVYQLVKDFDTHEARKALPANQRMKQDLQRESIEHEYHAQLTTCFERLRNATF